MDTNFDFSQHTYEPLVIPLGYIHAIRNGDVTALRSLLQEEKPFIPNERQPGWEERLSLLPSVAMSICMAASMEGGLPEEQGRALCAYYQGLFQSITSEEGLPVVMVDLLTDFTEQVFFRRLLESETSLVQKCNAYISMNIHHKIYMEDLAAYCGYSVSGMEHAYKKEVGHSISEQIRKTRLAKAKRLLETTNLTSATIAKQLCFSTQSYFINQFRREFHITPKEYRKGL